MTQRLQNFVKIHFNRILHMNGRIMNVKSERDTILTAESTSIKVKLLLQFTFLEIQTLFYFTKNNCFCFVFIILISE